MCYAVSSFSLHVKQMWITWTCQTLGLLEGMERLLQQMQGIGKLVKSFARSSKIPMQVLEVNVIVDSLVACVLMLKRGHRVPILSKPCMTSW